MSNRNLFCGRRLLPVGRLLLAVATSGGAFAAPPDVPPGLAKKDPPGVPPGQAKKPPMVLETYGNFIAGGHS